MGTHMRRVCMVAHGGASLLLAVAVLWPQLPLVGCAPNGSPPAAQKAFQYATALFNQGKAGEAAQGFLQAIKAGARGSLLATAYYNSGVLLRNEGDLEGALRSYKGATEVEPSSTQARGNMCNLLRAMSSFADASECFKVAAQLKPTDALTRALIGDTMYFAHAAQGKDTTAAQTAKVRREVVKNLKHAVRLDPSMAELYANIGKIYEDAGQRGSAMQMYEFGIAAKGASPVSRATAYFNMGVVLNHNNDTEGSERSYRAAVALNPAAASSYSNLGKLLTERDDFEESVAFFRIAAALEPNTCSSHVNIGSAYRSMGWQKASQARIPLETAVRVDPACQKAHAGLGAVLTQLQEFGPSLVPLEAAIRLDPEDEASFMLLADSRTWVASWHRQRKTNTKLLGIFENEANGIPPKSPEADKAKPDTDNPTIDFHYPMVTLAGHLRMARLRSAWYLRKALRKAEKEGIHLGQAPMPASPMNKLKVVYMSSKFRNHGLSHLVSSMFKVHDRSRFHITVVATSPDDPGTPWRPRIKASVDRFIEADGLSDPKLALTLRELGGQVLHDLDGLTRGHKPEALALQPVPVQVNTMEYPGTIGAPYIQYITTDRIVGTPLIMAEGYTERASLMPWTYFANSYHHHFGEIEAATRKAETVRPVQEDSLLVSSFNQFYKMDPETYSVWMNGLRRSDVAYLWLLAYNPEGMGNLRLEGAGRGLHVSRIVFGETAEKATHLARITAADLSVDTLKCNGLTTTTDTMFFSVPGITMPREKMAARAAASIAWAGGMGQLQHSNLKSYEDTFTKLTQ